MRKTDNPRAEAHRRHKSVADVSDCESVASSNNAPPRKQAPNHLENGIVEPSKIRTVPCLCSFKSLLYPQI